MNFPHSYRCAHCDLVVTLESDREFESGAPAGWFQVAESRGLHPETVDVFTFCSRLCLCAWAQAA